MNQIIGKQQTLNYFKLAVCNKTLSHMYIIEAPDGQGKRTMAAYVASMIHCLNATGPCGGCAACAKHEGGNHPDLIWISGDEQKHATIGVDIIRNMTADIYIKPLISDVKIYIIAGAQNLSTEAQNALLKVLEEPPSYAVIFLLTTSADALLRTVLSRGIVLKLKANTKQEIYDYIKNNYPGKTDREAMLIASFASGNIGVAKNMLQNDGFLEMRRNLYDALIESGTEKKSCIFAIINIFEKYKTEINTLLELLIYWFRDALYVKTVMDTGGILNTDYQDNIIFFASKTRADGMIKAADHIGSISSTIGKGSNITLWVTDMLIKCWEDLHG